MSPLASRRRVAARGCRGVTTRRSPRSPHEIRTDGWTLPRANVFPSFPAHRGPLTSKTARIRGRESHFEGSDDGGSPCAGAGQCRLPEGPARDRRRVNREEDSPPRLELTPPEPPRLWIVELDDVSHAGDVTAVLDD